MRIFLYDHGSKAEIRTHSPASDELIATCEEALTSADPGKMMQLAVLPSTIEDIHRKASSIEVIYSRPKWFTVSSSGRRLQINRLLIQLSALPPTASPKDKVVIVFYGSSSYSSGPYANSGEFDARIRRLLRNAGHPID